MLSRPSVLFLGVIALGSACERAETPAAPPAAAPAPAASPSTASPPAATPESARAEAQQIFVSRCVTCHGPEGAGNGPASAGLTPPPRNLQEPAWQTSVSDTHIEQIIQYGGAAVGKSPAMPANPDLMAKPEVVAALREHVRSLSSR